jgi:peptidoglycan/LPS O-acetylase OafA/YrhL
MLREPDVGVWDRQVSAASSDSTASEPLTRRFRPDIQGLRAIAILLVVLYHAGVPGISGGYVGVDVFFVISGYLITGQLVRELDTTGRISLTTFYLKRARRLLPSAVAVILITLLLACAFAPPLVTIPLSVDAVFAAAYVLNYRLAAEGINYQNAGATPSAFQHFWSLGVEEQFYICWPLLIIFAVLITRRWWRDLLPVFFLGVVGISLYISQYLISADAPMSYFSVASRAWEFGIGGILALGSGALARIPSKICAGLFLAGLGVIIFAGVHYNAGTQFPGIKAIPPALGAALVIGAGSSRQLSTEAILDNPVMQWLGKVSYQWYLWHWPILILAPYIWPEVTFTWRVNLGLVALALGLAAITYYTLDAPIRKMGFNKAFWAVAGLILMGVTVATSGVADSRLTAMIATQGIATQGSATSTLRPVPGKHTVQAGSDPFSSTPTSGAVYPSVLKAATDTPDYPADCIVDYAATTSPECLIGPDGSESDAAVTSNRIVLLGDSHAGEWYPDVYDIARKYGWDTEVLNKDGCPLASITTDNSAVSGSYWQCTEWRTGMINRLLNEPRPKIIFIASLNYYTADNTLLEKGWQETIQALRAIGAPIVYLHDTPYPNFNVPTCLSGALDDWSKCSFERSVAFHTDPLMSGTAASHGLAGRVNVDKFLCPPKDATCPAVLGGILLYRDNSHVTNTAMSMLVPVVQEQLQVILKSVLKS